MKSKVHQLVYSPHEPPTTYDPPVVYEETIEERDIMIEMRDGIKVCADVFRPKTEEPVPALLSFALHYKDWQRPEEAKLLQAQPAWSSAWVGHLEAGDIEFFVSRGYAHIIGNPRGVGKSQDGKPSEYDVYDVIEWIARQPWCDGQVGMVGLSSFGMAQVLAAKLHPPHLKAIAPLDPGFQYFQDIFPGGVLDTFHLLPWVVSAVHQSVKRPGELNPDDEELWKKAMANPDYRMYLGVYNILTMKGEISHGIFDSFRLLLSPFNAEGSESGIEEMLSKIDIPMYMGSGSYAYTYKIHLLGVQSLWQNTSDKLQKKFILWGEPHMERPFHESSREILRWYDQLFKGIENGIMEEPRVKMWVNGRNKWLYSDDWPLPQTEWTRLFLNSWERLRTEPYLKSSRDGYDYPDSFVQMPPTLTNKIQSLRYYTDPLPDDVLMVGPISLTLYASIDKEDTNWIVALKDVGPDVSVRTARSKEREIPSNTPERELTRGWLKASNRVIDTERSRPWRPWHPLTKSMSKPVTPGEITEYQIEILPTVNLFKRDHHICLEIMSMDLPTGVAGVTDVEYIPYHICSSSTTLHNIYHNEKYPSHLLLPIIPNGTYE